MKRRAFCASTVSVAALAAIPWQRVLAAGGTDEISAVGLDGRPRILKGSDVEDLRRALRGELLLPGQAGYDAARRIWNGAFDRRPALIARCSGAADVVQAVTFARTHELLLAVRGGGHSLSGQSVCEGGMMIDLAPMKAIRVDPASRTARLEPGVLLGQFDREAQAFGLATTAGTISHTGAAGLTLGGGFGRVGRRFALACDNLITADVVTADGRLVKAGEQDERGLLWGLRGGGGNFGIVTSFEYRLHPLAPGMHGGPLVFPLAGARALLRSFGDFIATASDALYVDVMFVPTPDGQRVVALDVCHSGDTAAAERELAQLRKLGRAVQDGLRPATYVELQSAGDNNFPAGRCYYIKSGFMPGITPAVADTVVDYVESAPLATGIVALSHMGGAISRVARDATAFWHREAQHSLLVAGFWDQAAMAEPSMQWVRAGWKSFEPLTSGFYVNELSYDEAERRIRAAYGDNYARLVALKRQYDPTNLFRLNANIRPVGG
ncbi:MAG: FAD-binding oxidoreductase [Gammaproteobacteria bacterium]|nr:FAD-binding oxidoreductase [Gammaproteobacteria bacterium]